MNPHDKYGLFSGSAATLILFLVLMTGTPAAALQQPEEDPVTFLKSLSIEDLLQTQITSVSKKSEQLFDAAAAVTVITQEDIERSGALSIPEALRLVPGLQVAQIDASRYAISVRGFNDYYANKLLVLIDGRSVYTPLFSGVLWNAQDTLIEDIERIEVIRGPGATVWGANAVNGVINIITKDSADTQGGLLSTAVGSHLLPLVSTRYGGRLDDKTTYRLFAKGFQREAFDSASDDGDAHDAWESERAGFRADRNHTDRDTLTLATEVYSGEADMTTDWGGITGLGGTSASDSSEDFNGGHVLAAWDHRFTARSTIDLQMYYDYTSRVQDVGEESRDTADIEFKHHWDPHGIHDIVWGSGFRWTEDEITGSEVLIPDPTSRSDNLWSAFLQDDINIIADSVWLTLGSKIEHNDYSGVEVQPSARLRYKPSERQLIWTAVSRAVRTPSRSDHDFEINAGEISLPGFPVPANARLFGNESLDSEQLTAYELGYRWQASDALSFDLATYYNDYNDLRTLEPSSPYLDASVSPPRLVLPTYLQNGLEGNTYGFELQGTWQATDTLKIFAAYSRINFDLHYKNPQLAGSVINEEDLTPQQQLQLRSYLDLPHDLAFDTEVYYVDELENHDIDAYWRLDLQLSWQARKQLRISIAAENLFDAGHQEFPENEAVVPAEIPQQFWLKATYTF